MRRARDLGPRARRRALLRAAAGLLAVLGACASPTGGDAAGGAAAAGGGRVVPYAELPERERSVWEAWNAGGATWESRRAEVLADPALSAFLVDNLVREMVRSYDRAALARPGHAPGPFERSRAELVRLGATAVPVLVGLLAVPDGIVAFLAADTLRAIGTPAIEPTGALLRHPSAETRRRAAELLGDLPPAGAAETALLAHLGELGTADPEWIVRAQSLRTLGRRGRSLEHKGFTLGLLLRGMRDSDPAVAETAAEAIGVLGERRAIPRVIEILPELSAGGAVRAAAAAQRALNVLAGDDQERSLAEWRAYWTVNEARILAEIRAQQPARH